MNDIDYSKFDLVPFDATSLYTNISISLVHKMLDFWMDFEKAALARCLREIFEIWGRPALGLV